MGSATKFAASWAFVAESIRDLLATIVMAAAGEHLGERPGGNAAQRRANSVLEALGAARPAFLSVQRQMRAA